MKEKALEELKKLSLFELRNYAKLMREGDNHSKAIEAYQLLDSKEDNIWNKYFLAVLFRKTGQFDAAETLHKVIENREPNFAPLKSEKLWFIYSKDLKQANGQSMIYIAEGLIKKVEQNRSQFTDSIFNKTIIYVAKKLAETQGYETSISWLYKIKDFSKLSREPFFPPNNPNAKKKYDSEQKTYFMLYAQALIGLDKVKEKVADYLDKLNFTTVKKKEFIEAIVSKVEKSDYLPIKTYVLAKILKSFEDELKIRKTGVENISLNPYLTVSEVSDYIFCPVSFAINASINVSTLISSWEKGQREDDLYPNLKKYYDKFQETKDYANAFNNVISKDNINIDLQNILSSKLMLYGQQANTYFTNEQLNLRGMPQYVFEASNKTKFIVMEKVEKNSSQRNLFPNEQAKIELCLSSFPKEQFAYGYMIFWYYDDNDNFLDYHIIKINKSTNNQNLLSTIEQVNIFRQNKYMSIDPNKVSYPNKCVNCSVQSICKHKTGSIKEVILPYKL